MGRCHRPVDGRPLGLVRIALCLVIALDQLRLLDLEVRIDVDHLQHLGALHVAAAAHLIAGAHGRPLHVGHRLGVVEPISQQGDQEPDLKAEEGEAEAQPSE